MSFAGQRALPRELFDAVASAAVAAHRRADMERGSAIDASEDNFAAMVLPDAPALPVAAGIDLRARLTENDACGVVATPGDPVVTGPTRTNVNDFRAILIDKTESQAGEE